MWQCFLDTTEESYLFNPCQNQWKQARAKHSISQTAESLSKTPAGQQSAGDCFPCTDFQSFQLLVHKNEEL